MTTYLVEEYAQHKHFAIRAMDDDSPHGTVVLELTAAEATREAKAEALVKQGWVVVSKWTKDDDNWERVWVAPVLPMLVSELVPEPKATRFRCRMDIHKWSEWTYVELNKTRYGKFETTVDGQERYCVVCKKREIERTFRRYV